MAKSRTPKRITTLTHTQAKRTNIPTAEHQSVMNPADLAPRKLRYPRNTDLDPQLVWRGKDQQDSADLLVDAPPIYIQEKVHPKALIDDLKRGTARRARAADPQPDLFADFNGLPEGPERTEFYRHEQNWSNRMILGDSLNVMAGIAEREGLRGSVQCIYFDPPYGIKFNSNFQWSTTSRDVKDGKAEHITREPEQVKAFRDTWRDGIHSYLAYLRDRLTVARDLLTDSGSIFVQIGDENVHRVRAVMDEVFGDENFVASVLYRTTGGFATKGLSRIGDNILWYSKNLSVMKFRSLYAQKSHVEDRNYRMLEDMQFFSKPMSEEQQAGHAAIPKGARVWRYADATGQGSSEVSTPIDLNGNKFEPSRNTHWKASYPDGIERLKKAGRLIGGGKTLSYKRYFSDYSVKPVNAVWLDTGISGFASEKVFVVQTGLKVIERCILMTTDPGDLVLDPTCGSGTTAYVAEQWGRRWITIDTSRVALTLARTRIMGARYPYYLLADSDAGHQKEAEIQRRAHIPTSTYGDIRHGFVYQRVPHITLKSIANNAEIDVLYDEHQPAVLQALADLNSALAGHAVVYKVTSGGRAGHTIAFNAEPKPPFVMPGGREVSPCELLEWEVPREAPADWPGAAAEPLGRFWQARIRRQTAIDASIAAKAEFEYLYDKPFEDAKTVRVAGPFTVESLSPHRVLGVDENDEPIDPHTVHQPRPDYTPSAGFESMILEELRRAGVQQSTKNDRITFSALGGWPGEAICSEAHYHDGTTDRRAGIFIGPEFGTVTRTDLVEAAREAGEAGFDVVISCAFNYDSHAAEFSKLGRIQVLKARMNADLHMADTLKSTDKANLFVVFGEPDIEIRTIGADELQVQVRGIDVFDPSTAQVRSDNTDRIACWLIDTDYNGESFFVRHAYFLGAGDPYKSLKTTLKAEIDPDAWASLRSDTSRPFPRPQGGRIAVKVINHLGDEVMKVSKV